ncbi:Rid family hydrolase, partial [Helicobacter pylori]
MKEVIHSTLAPKAIGPYSQAIATNDLVFVSGQLGIDVSTGEFKGA